MPLVWAHAEYVKLCRSLADGKVFDMPPQPVQRYQMEQRGSDLTIWRFNHKCQQMDPGRRLRIEVRQPALLRWTTDNWRTVMEDSTRDTGLGLHLIDLPTETLAGGEQLAFTFYWPGDSRWEGSNYQLTVSTTTGVNGR